MKYQLSNLLIAAAASLGLAACGDIAEDERFVEVNEVTPVRNVLVEEYTGQKCVNCPDAQALLHEQEAKYNTNGETHIITVCIHHPNYGMDVDAGGLVIPECSVYANRSGADSAPTATFDRKTSAQIKALWMGSLLGALRRPAYVSFSDLNAHISNGTIKVKGSVVASENVDDAKLQLWLVEDKVTKAANGMPLLQFMGDGSIDVNYVHNNVLRAAINGTYGEDFPLEIRKDRTFEANYPLPDFVQDATNCRIVAFVYTDGEGVYNTVTFPLAQ